MYLTVSKKFTISHLISFCWLLFSIFLSLPWLFDLKETVGYLPAVMIISGVGYIPGYINAFNVTSLLLDKQPVSHIGNPRDDITIVIACRNEEDKIPTTLEYIKKQNYSGTIKVIVVDNASSDDTAGKAKLRGLDVKVIYEPKPGKFNALNTALNFIDTEYYITVDADTLLHESAVRYLVSRLKYASKNIYAIAGAVLVRNSRENLLTRLQEWDYFLGIASIKRMQGLYQGTLVAQGAFSLYKTEYIRSIGGYPDAIGEDILITWKILSDSKKVYFEPLAIAFTEVPNTFKHFAKQRSRWARGMIEAILEVQPWKQPLLYVKFLTGINLMMPYLDVVYTFCWIPGLILAFFGIYWIVGPITLLVLPLAILQNYILFSYQKNVFKKINLKIRKNILGLILYVLFYQIVISPISVIGYIQEIFKLRRVWK